MPASGSGLALVDVVREHEPEGSDGRPGLSYALERLEHGEASCLVVSDWSVSREVAELAGLVDRLEQSQRLIAIDVGLDTATPSGRLAVSPREVPTHAGEEVQPQPAAATEVEEPAVAEPAADAPGAP